MNQRVTRVEGMMNKRRREIEYIFDLKIEIRI
jgi:hypothetical protein